ncbi:hypothetical protein Fmac_025791 [Flemingia macrophylla]|uniref:Uncharacterized protein n=1 Tax=Flemingia macrophylla TaxID=520843 RepID=A0ABD1LD34_9FABA
MSGDLDMYTGNTTVKANGALSVVVLGEVAGLHDLWKQKGKLPWKRLVEPYEIVGRRGFKISPYLDMQTTQ